jgi:hypothetical protein
MSTSTVSPSVVRPLHIIANDIGVHWSNVNFAAKPYLDAMAVLSGMNGVYGWDSAQSIVSYFLSNANSWRGEDAKRIKAELKAMLKAMVR